MVLSVLLHREVWCCLCCSIEKYGVVRVAPESSVCVALYRSMVLSMLLHTYIWCCPCCSIEKYGVVRVAL